MKYTHEINKFKAEVKRLYQVNDCSKSKKGTKVFEILVTGRENGEADVELRYKEEFYRMFGRVNTAYVKVFGGSLKDACKVARELKTEVNFPIVYIEYEESLMF